MISESIRLADRARFELSPILAVSAFWLLALVGVQFAPLSGDSWWQMWIARQMNAGIPLYEWINETNPPLWFWMARPIAYIAAITGLPQPNLMVTGIMIEIAVSLALCSVFLRNLSQNRQTILLLGMLFCMVVPHFIEFGQRDHMALIALPPYALLIAERSQNRSVAARLALAIGCFAALMIALKPHVAAVPIGIEFWLICRVRRFQPIRPETLALALGAITYIGAIQLFAPAYFTEILPSVATAYGDFGGSKLRVFFERAALLLPLVALYFWAHRKTIPPQAQVLLVMGIGFAVSMFVQLKGFLYHGDPVASSMLMAILFNVIGQSAPVAIRKRALLAAIIGFSLLPLATNERYLQSYAAPLVADLPTGTKIATILVDPTHTWPLLEQHGFINVSRYYHHWMLPTLHKALIIEQRLPPDLELIADDVRADFVNDLMCNPPDVLLVIPGLLSRQHEVIDFLGQNPDLAKLLSAYAPGPALAELARYNRIADLPTPSVDRTCYTIAP